VPNIPLIQHQFAFNRPPAARTRNCRRPFSPARDNGTYRLPHEIRDRLALALTPYKNREAAFTLAIFLARYWSVPGRVAGSFPIDRRAVADHANLGLSEARIRGATRTLEAVGYIERAIPASGSRYRATENGELRRKVILFGWGADYAPAFLAANKRARITRSRHASARRSNIPAASSRPSSAFLTVWPLLKSPKNKSEAESQVIMGEIREKRRLPPPITNSNPLEAALERLRRAIDEAEYE
jgi:hypothetical protein